MKRTVWRMIWAGTAALAAASLALLWGLLGSPADGAAGLDDPAAYLPQPGRTYTYSITYPDGQQTVLEVLTVRIPWGPLLSQLEVPRESQPYGVHTVRRPEGLYTVWEQDPDNDFLYLPATVRPGVTWLERDGSGNISKTGETVTVAAGTFQDCVRIARQSEESGLTTESWYAPGVGLIQTMDTQTGEVSEALDSVQGLGLLGRLRVVLAVPKANRFREKE